MSIAIDGYAHVRLTVTDIARSRAFYDQVFALPVALKVPADADEQTRQHLGFLYGRVIYHPRAPDGHPLERHVLYRLTSKRWHELHLSGEDG